MNKLLASALLGLMGLSTVATSVIPEANYNENLKTKLVENNKEVKKAAREVKPIIKGTKAYLGGGVINVGELNTTRYEYSEGSPMYDYVDIQPDGQILIDGGFLSPGFYYFQELVGYEFIFADSSFSGEVTNSNAVYIEDAYEVTDFVLEGNTSLTNDAYNRWIYIEKDSFFQMHLDASCDDVSFNITKALSVSPADLQAPTIDGQNHFVVNVNNPISREEILTHIRATDETDGVVNVIWESCNYNPSNLTLGEFSGVVSATDKAGNKTTVNITIHVVDIDKPVISGTSTYNLSYDAPTTEAKVREALSVSDNFDEGLQIQLVQDNYTGKERVVGSHTITYKAVDSSNNESDIYTVTINVSDKNKPVITAPGSITVPTSQLLSLESLKSKIIVEDALDGTIIDYTIDGYDNYKLKYNIVGTYNITITARDKSGNTATATIKITTEDKLGPEIFFDQYFIIISKGQSITQEQIKDMASKVLGINVDAISEVSGEYDTTLTGVYKMSVKTITGETYSFDLNVQANYDDSTRYRDLKWYEYIYEWFLILFNIEDEYKTESFWDFKTRCGYIGEVYSSGKILDDKLEGYVPVVADVDGLKTSYKE